ncbi:gamma-glutamylcyclotransferase family protein [Dyella sp. C11]|uniref:gamma-glutamylcyclotransferase family protein n=1 Tax=Dyella sp. C11 TaxID=2126991 RepID=UPI0018E52279|nr:gamma-glutamylcyclotransferase family protein [Dyella sp. C11]
MMPAEPRDELLFSYGTLQLERVQLESFGRLLDGEDDAMPGYRQALIEITDPEVLRQSGERFHPIVVPSGDVADQVTGKVFRVTAAELAAADRYEVADYQRVAVQLKSGKRAWVYIKA